MSDNGKEANWFIAGTISGVLCTTLLARTYGDLPTNVLVAIPFVAMIVVLGLAGVTVGLFESVKIKTKET